MSINSTHGTGQQSPDGSDGRRAIGFCRSCLAIGRGDVCSDCGGQMFHGSGTLAEEPAVVDAGLPRCEPADRLVVDLTDEAPRAPEAPRWREDTIGDSETQADLLGALADLSAAPVPVAPDSGPLPKAPPVQQGAAVRQAPPVPPMPPMPAAVPQPEAEPAVQPKAAAEPVADQPQKPGVAAKVLRPVVIGPAVAAAVVIAGIGGWFLIHENDRASAKEAVAQTSKTLDKVIADAGKARTLADIRRVGEEAKAGMATASAGVESAGKVSDSGFRSTSTGLLTSYSEVLAGYAGLAKLDPAHPRSSQIGVAARTVGATGAKAAGVDAALAAARNSGVAPAGSPTGAEVRSSTSAMRVKLRGKQALFAKWEADTRAFRAQQRSDIAAVESYFSSAIGILNRYDSYRSDLDHTEGVWDGEPLTPASIVSASLTDAHDSRMSLLDELGALTAPDGFSPGADSLNQAIQEGANAISDLNQAIDEGCMYDVATCTLNWQGIKDLPAWEHYHSQSGHNTQSVEHARSSLNSERSSQIRQIKSRRGPAQPRG